MIMTGMKKDNTQIRRFGGGWLAMLLIGCLHLASCIKDFDIRIKPNKPQLVVEAYLNNLIPENNYVILSRSLDYLSDSLQASPVSNARVFVTEGEYVNGRYTWNTASKTILAESALPMIPPNFKTGVYADARLRNSSSAALLGKPGKSYLLEISEGDNQYTAITTLLQPVPIDSLTIGFRFTDEEDSMKQKARLTNHYKDPDTLNNTQLYYFKFYENRQSFGWGGLSRTRAAGTDDITNGEYIRLTHPRGFLVGDTVDYYMASVTRDIYQFWDSYNKARDNNGPFATPVVLKSNIIGENVTGCFSGLSMSTKRVIIR